ncbi:MAG: glucose-6-phosphate isomerase [Methanomicrobiales archaeon]|nr:glucose-6-phosphate isomerase [Methanomicrobiales archaeon]NYT20296.1 glucose-6-phosphate isomerase [Methanomicrobiales archaeon]
MQCWNGPLPSPDVRTIEDMGPVLADPSCRERGPLYFMYRDLALAPQDRTWLADHHIRYDITVISPRDLCGELAKTKGHYHPISPTGIPYPEIYEVLEGSAHYLLQKRDLSDIIVVAAGVGDLVVVPPGYGHVTINAGRSDLVMANLVSSAFSSEYDEYERLRGGAYYELSGGKVVKNPAYPDLPLPRSIRASQIRPRLPFAEGGLYDLVGSDQLAFLNVPEKENSIFTPYQRV